VRTRWFPLLVVAAAIAAVPVVSTDRLWLDVLVQVLIFATFATAWNMAAGGAGLFSFGHSALFAIGAYGAAVPYARLGLSPYLGAAAAALLAMLAALVIGIMSLRLRGHYFALATLAFGQVFFVLVTNLTGLTGGSEGLTLPFHPGAANLTFTSIAPYVYIALALYLATAATAVVLRGRRVGYQMLAVREDQSAARSLGIPALRVKLFAIAVSGLFAALAGSLYAFYTLFITPQNTASLDVATQPVVMAVIGGMFAALGPLVGAALILSLNQMIISVVGAEVSGLSGAIYGALLIVVILTMPDGLLGMAGRLLDGAPGGRRLRLAGRGTRPVTAAAARDQEEARRA
jgi:branched-chain amino acid transport system permease protein